MLRRYRVLGAAGASIVAALVICAAYSSSGSYTNMPSLFGEAATSLGILATVPQDLTGRDEDNYKWWTEARLRRLLQCQMGGRCHANAIKVAIFGAYHCHIAMFEGYTGGEGIWCKAMIDNLEDQGYTVLHARDDWKYIYHIHRQIPDLVKVIMAGKDGPTGKASDYYKSDRRPDGIPAWKHFHFSYFPNMGQSVVGDRWTVCAEPEWYPEGGQPRNYTFAGYSLEPQQSETPVIPFSQRPHRAYIMSKRIQYFYQWANPMWEREYFTRASEELKKLYPDFEFVGGFVDDRGDEARKAQGVMELPQHVRNLGLLNAEQFDEEVGKARIMIGLGWPTMSPSPYRGLARGVPFLNPHKMGAHSSEDNRASWIDTQHATLRFIEEPYVYHEEAYNYDSFLRAIKTAMETPIEPFRFDWHSREAFTARMQFFMDADWESEAATILAARQDGKETQGHGGGQNLGIFTI